MGCPASVMGRSHLKLAVDGGSARTAPSLETGTATKGRGKMNEETRRRRSSRKRKEPRRTAEATGLKETTEGGARTMRRNSREDNNNLTGEAALRGILFKLVALAPRLRLRG